MVEWSLWISKTFSLTRFISNIREIMLEFRKETSARKFYSHLFNIFQDDSNALMFITDLNEFDKLCPNNFIVSSKSYLLWLCFLLITSSIAEI